MINRISIFTASLGSPTVHERWEVKRKSKKTNAEAVEKFLMLLQKTTPQGEGANALLEIGGRYGIDTWFRAKGRVTERSQSLGGMAIKGVWTLEDGTEIHA